MTCLMILDSVMIAPLLKLSFFFSKKQCPAALFFDSGSDRYEASEFKAKIMSLAKNIIPAFGCVAQ